MKKFDLEVLKAIPIDYLIGKYIETPDFRNNFSCPLPGHEDSTPSFRIFGDNNTFKCFGCGCQGSTIDFIMIKEECSFVDACTILSDVAGYIPEKDLIKKIEAFETREQEITEKDMEIYLRFSELSQLTGDGIEYLFKRGFTEATINKFKVGSIDNPKRAARILLNDFTEEELIGAGIFGVNRHGKVYFTFFRPAIIWPFFNDSGFPIFFSSRNLDGDIKSFKLYNRVTPYYIGDTSGENIFIIEGMPDILSFYQIFGTENYICTNGLPNVRQYKRITELYPWKNIILALDNDNAGKSAADRIINEAGQPVPVFEWGKLGNVKDFNDYLMRQ